MFVTVMPPVPLPGSGGYELAVSTLRTPPDEAPLKSDFHVHWKRAALGLPGELHKDGGELAPQIPTNCVVRPMKGEFPVHWLIPNTLPPGKQGSRGLS
jgi:hypothetical protein